ncbi:esterase [Burkholderia stagnalis]|uniref:extracellular catalytic domain type 1 short-chain-length polyhydroxyalkanoate depolymerase n=1 Tax=Burkholderia stagnalis TaxID=1503054 RepID=UPI000755E087|nr:PHB depolymerase family esterase [Burkholderia stagnalis]KVD84671.1 esterase [Burkholderia stagnalis]KWK21775.1 esterase [Burkholderia stagnalis]KWK48015.1 esterase [Burkholderia stagnalis]KWK66665.1 esterase [Burkholderia stagnalis]KWN71934.1 esterase [Burkholderia stagnalis]
MTKSLTKMWLGGMKRMLSPPAKRATRDAQRVALDVIEAAVSPAIVDLSPPPARESRVRPRAAAWAAGEWTRAEQPMAPAIGRLVQQLAYGLYLPPGRRRPGMPLVVMLHGCQQTIDEFAQGTRMNLLADRYGFAVLYPEQSLRAHAHGCWHWYEDTERAGRGEAHAIASLVDKLVGEYRFDASRVYVAGLSAGAGLASLLALHFPERFAAIALHSGPAFGEANSGIAAMDVMRRGLRQSPIEAVDALVGKQAHPGMPALIVHGDGDHVVSPKNADQLATQFLRLNRLADSRGALRGGERVEARESGMQVCDYRRGGASVVRLCHVKGLDHAWAGGDEAVPFHAAVGPDASEMIWSFFEGHRRAVAAERRTV